MEHRDGYWGLLFWGVLIGASAFLLSKKLWFDSIAPGDKALFWTNLAVAVGTLTLAAVTYWNVTQTNRVIAGEDRRHQQQFAPLIVLYDYTEPDKMGNRYGFGISNIGLGLAIDIVVAIRATLYFETPVMKFLSPEDLERLKAEAVSKGGGWSYQSSGDKPFVWEQRSESEPIAPTYSCSALNISGGVTYFSNTEVESKIQFHGRLEYSSVGCTYTDMFGNAYRTVYNANDLDSYEWVRPKHLKVPSV